MWAPQGLVLILLATLGLSALAGSNDWEPAERAEFVLCAWLAAGLGAYLSGTVPVFTPYFVLVAPFLGILAAVGLYALGTRVWGPSGRSAWLVLLVVGLFSLELARPALHAGRHLRLSPQHVGEVREVALEVDRVTPAEGEVYADEVLVYFASRRVPPTGLENPWSRELAVAPALAASIRVVSAAQLDGDLAAGRFATVAIDHGSPRVESLGLARRYAGRTRIGHFDLFWGRASAPPGS